MQLIQRRRAYAVIVLPLGLAAQTFTVNVDSQSVLFDAGQSSPTTGLGGILPPSVSFSAGAGKAITVCSVTGAVTFSLGTLALNGPDGFSTSGITDVTNLNGIAGLKATNIGFLAGVFLDATTPSGPGPARLDFTSSGLGQSFASLSPALFQTFFVGDGKTGTGSGSFQTFNAPSTATRFFLGFVDGCLIQSGLGPGCYGDNSGSFTATFTFDGPAACACPPHTVHGHISTVPPDHYSGIAVSHQHHGQHGHTVAAGCPPHAPGHSPGLTADDGGGLLGPDFTAILDADGTARPARAGAVVQLFGSSIGLFLGDGDEQAAYLMTAPASPLYHTTSLPEVRIGGLAAQVLFSGLAPGLRGVWQINAVVPDSLPPGRHPVRLVYEGQELRSVDLAVE